MQKLLILEEADGLPKSTQLVLFKLLSNKKRSSRQISFILTCNDITEIIGNLKSLFFVIKFEKISEANMQKNLLWILESENIPYEGKCLERVSLRSNGDMRIALNYLQNMANSYKAIEDVYFDKVLNEHNPLINNNFIETCLEKNFYKILEIIEDVIDQGYNFNQIKDFFKDCLQKMNSFSLKVSELLKLKLEILIEKEKGNTSQELARIYGFFADVFKIIENYSCIKNRDKN